MDKIERSRQSLIEKLTSPDTDVSDLFMDIFAYQHQYNPVYRQFCEYLSVNPLKIEQLEDIPFLPISAFKHHKVVTGHWEPQLHFTSSGTTGQQPSTHYVRDLQLYHSSCMRSIEPVYGDPAQYTWLALLPSYLERGGSSLVEMVRYFSSLSNNDHGFYLNDFQALADRIRLALNRSEQVILIGVSYALLDFADLFPIRLSLDFTVMETGGMKGRKQEMTRTELHRKIREAFGITRVHSEYGMTELMHQFYAPENGIFEAGNMAIPLVREINDPLRLHRHSAQGLLNIFDPGNLDSCSFIATDDIATIHRNGTFELLGRSDNSEMRGCNLLYTGSENISIE